MIQTVSWMVQRDGEPDRDRASRRVLSWFLVGGTVGGGLTGLLVSGLAALLEVALGHRPSIWGIAAATLAMVYSARAFGLVPVPRPQVPHQVPSSWRDVLPTRVASFAYAGGLGVLFATRVTSLVVYPLAALALATGRQDPTALIALFALVGLVRAATALPVYLLRLDQRESRDVADVLNRQFRYIPRLDGVALLLFAAAALTLVVNS